MGETWQRIKHFMHPPKRRPNYICCGIDTGMDPREFGIFLGKLVVRTGIIRYFRQRSTRPDRFFKYDGVKAQAWWAWDHENDPEELMGVTY